MNTFHPFPRLPYELRMQIWEMTVEPRTIQIRAKKREWTTSDLTRGQRYERNGLFSPTSAPAILHVCQEVRNHGLYQKGLSEVFSFDCSGIQYIWLNWEIDIIDIGSTSFSYFTPIAELMQLLMFQRDFQDEGFFQWESHEVAAFKNLKEIYVTCIDLDVLYNWAGAFDVGHIWPCGRENMYFIDQSSGRVFRGEGGLDEIQRLDDLESASRGSGNREDTQA